MVRINKHEVEMEGEVRDILAELASAFTFLSDKTDRTTVIASFLASFYCLQAERDNKSLIEGIEMFKQDTKEALNLIGEYSSFEGKNVDEKYKNYFGTEDL